MDAKLRQAIQRWLQRQREQRWDEAEAALRQVFLALPPRDPGPEFVNAVMARTFPRLQAPVVPAWGLRLASSVALVVSGASLLSLPSLVGALSARVDSTGLLLTLGRVLAALPGRISDFLGVGRLAGDVAHAVGLAVMTPQGLAFLAITTVVGAAAFRLLLILTPSDRSAIYVQSGP